MEKCGGVQFVFYQQSELLMCMRCTIEFTHCLCAKILLLTFTLACVQVRVY